MPGAAAASKAAKSRELLKKRKGSGSSGRAVREQAARGVWLLVWRGCRLACVVGAACGEALLVWPGAANVAAVWRTCWICMFV